MFEGFESVQFRHAGVELQARCGGRGPALLLLHGHPQTSAMWHRVAPALAERFSVVAMDLRGYGDSGRPDADPGHVAHSKRAMAADAVALMASLGHDRFDVCAHDRGARVAHRLALDAPARVGRMMLLDIAPTLVMYEGTTEAFARAYWHWFLLIQPAPLPDRWIEADPVFYLRSVMGRRQAGMAAFDPEALAEYERCIRRPGSARSICEDYRASASIDLEHDRADRRRLLRAPVLALWGRDGTVARCFDPLADWRRVALDVEGRALPCGHFLPEERPRLVLGELRRFLARVEAGRPGRTPGPVTSRPA
jgi:haloacetate dehalogenase